MPVVCTGREGTMHWAYVDHATTANSRRKPLLNVDTLRDRTTLGVFVTTVMISRERKSRPFLSDLPYKLIFDHFKTLIFEIDAVFFFCKFLVVDF